MLVRFIVPRYSIFNIFSGVSAEMVAVGPVLLATIISKLPGVQVEVIDENNLGNSRFCPKDENGLPDYRLLQAIRPADIIAFYGSMTSSMPRVYELAKMFRTVLGLPTIAGGKHVDYMAGEALNNDIDIVLRGECEQSIITTVKAYLEARTELLVSPGVSLVNLWKSKLIKADEPLDGFAFKIRERTYISKVRPLCSLEEMEDLPIPDFRLVRYAKVRKFTVSWSRGCHEQCEFCTVNEPVRTPSAKKLFENITHLVETQGARKFFIVDDHVGGDASIPKNRQRLIEACRLLEEYQRYWGVSLDITVQLRINVAKYEDVLKALKGAGVKMVCIGYESPIDSKLKAMGKGYSSKDLEKWTKTFHKYIRFIHGMFIVGYPEENPSLTVPIMEEIRAIRRFVRKAGIDTIQALFCTPLVGSRLRVRLLKSGLIYDIPNQFHDGQFVLIKPANGEDPELVQQAAYRIMKPFYSPRYLGHLLINLLLFLGLHGLGVFSLLTMRVRYLVKIFKTWSDLNRNAKIRFFGSWIVSGWKSKFKYSGYLEYLAEAKKDKAA